MKVAMILHEPSCALVSTSPLGRLLIFTVILTVIFLSKQQLNYAQSYSVTNNDVNAESDLIDSVELGNLDRRIELLSMGAFAFCSLVVVRRSVLLRLVADNWLFTSFVALAMCSIFWADDRALTMRRVVEFFLLYMTALMLALRLCRRDCIRLAFWGSAIYLTVGVACELYFGTFAPLQIDYRFSGTEHPNHQAWSCALLVISALVLSRIDVRARNRYRIMAFVGLGFLVLTKSRTSIVCLILAGSIVALLGWSRKQKAALIFALLSAMLLLYVYQYDASSIIPKFVMASRGNASNLDLEGRVPIWELCIAYASARPLLGYGFEGFWNPSHIEWISSELHWAIPAAHNGYLDLVLSVGVIGLLLYVSQMGQALVRSFRSYQVTQASEWAFAIALLVFYVATMLTEAIATEMSLTRLIVFVVVMWHPTTERDKTMTTARQPVESTEHDLSHSFGDPLMMGGSLALQTDANGIEKRPNSIVS